MPTKDILIRSWSNSWAATKRSVSPSGDDSWISLSKYSGVAGLKDENVSVTVSENPLTNRFPRKGYIDVMSGGKTISVLVEQATDNPIIPAVISVNPITWNIPSIGGTKTDFVVTMQGDPILEYNIISKPVWITSLAGDTNLLAGNLSLSAASNENECTTNLRTGAIVLEHKQFPNPKAYISVSQDGKTQPRRNLIIELTFDEIENRIIGTARVNGIETSVTSDVLITIYVDVKNEYGGTVYNNPVDLHVWSGLIYGTASIGIILQSGWSIEANVSSQTPTPTYDDCFNYSTSGTLFYTKPYESIPESETIINE